MSNTTYKNEATARAAKLGYSMDDYSENELILTTIHFLKQRGCFQETDLENIVDSSLKVFAEKRKETYTEYFQKEIDKVSAWARPFFAVPDIDWEALAFANRERIIKEIRTVLKNQAAG